MLNLIIQNHLNIQVGNPYSISNLGTLYEYWIGFEKDYNKAFEFYQRAANSRFANWIGWKFFNSFLSRDQLIDN